MKNILESSILFLVIIVIGIYIYINYINKAEEDENKPAEILVITQSHYYETGGGDYGYFFYFTDQEDFMLVNHETTGYMQNNDLTFKFPIEDFRIVKDYNEVLDGKLYYGYRVKFKLPHIEGGLYVQNFNIKLTTNNETYQLYLGELYLDYHLDNNKYFPWFSYEASKVSDKPRLDKIYIGMVGFEMVYHVYIGPNEVDFFYSTDSLVIEIPDDQFVLLNTYVKIETAEGITYIPQFEYVTNYQLLASGIYQKYTEHLS